jgi:hypothetical protein
VIFIEPLTFLQKKSNISRLLAPCCGLEVRKTKKALKSVKGTNNTHDLNPKWARTFPLGIFHGIFIEPLPFPNKNQIS